MQSRSIPSVTLYIRITDEQGNRRYERVNRRNPQLNGGVDCLHFYGNGKRKVGHRRHRHQCRPQSKDDEGS